MSLAALWDARRVAVIGATERAGALGRLPVEFLLRYGFEGEVLPVNPRAERILGLPCYPSVSEAPGPIDLAMVMVAAARVPEALDDCAAAGVPVAIVASSGFAEAGSEGAALQDEAVAKANAGGVRLVGPNCIGSVAFDRGLVASFSPLFSADDVPMRAGDVAFVSQSGALGYGAVSLAMERGLRLGWAVNTGNEADVTALEVLAELSGLEECRALLGYVESLSDAPRLRALARTGKPLALVKAGSSRAGAEAAASHTGALAGEDRVVEAALRQLGIARARDVEELLDLGDAFDQPRRPLGPRLAVVTTSGGSGILAADAIEAHDLELAVLSPRTLEALNAIVPPFGSTANPVDITATVMSDPGLFDRCLEAVAADEGVDLIVACFCVLVGEQVDALVDSLARVAAASGKPVMVARTGAAFLAPDAARALRAAGIPAYPTPSRAVAAAAGLCRVSRSRGGSVDTPLLSMPPPVPEVTEPELKAFLAAAGVTVPRGRLASSPEDAVTAATEVGGRAVMKAVVSGLLHKTEVDGVVVGVAARDASATWEPLAALGGGVLVEELVQGGVEMLVGVAPSPLGPVLTVGAGGVLTEVLDDAAFRLLPVDAHEARSMIDELNVARLLAGVRGRSPADVDALVELLVRVSGLVAGWPEGFELDLNPVVVLPDRVCVLDAAYTLAAAGRQALTGHGGAGRANR